MGTISVGAKVFREVALQEQGCDYWSKECQVQDTSGNVCISSRWAWSSGVLGSWLRKQNGQHVVESATDEAKKSFFF